MDPQTITSCRRLICKFSDFLVSLECRQSVDYHMVFMLFQLLVITVATLEPHAESEISLKPENINLEPENVIATVSTSARTIPSPIDARNDDPAPTSPRER